MSSRRLLSLGTSLAITLPKEYAGEMGLEKGEEVVVVPEGRKLLILPMKLDGEGRKRLRVLVRRLRELRERAKEARDAEGVVLLWELEELLPWPEKSRAKLGELVTHFLDRLDLTPLLEAYREFERARAAPGSLPPLTQTAPPPERAALPGSSPTLGSSGEEEKNANQSQAR